MNIVDKMLVSAAGLALFGIFTILFTGEINSEYFPDKIESQDQNESKSDVVVYNKEVDEIIELYFKNIKENPNKLEEENRILNSNPDNNESSEITQSDNAEKEKDKDSFSVIKHRVKSGDSLWRLSQQYNIPVYSIVSFNKSKEKEIIHPGEILDIPNQKGVLYKIKNGDALSKIAQKHKISMDSIKNANDLETDIIHRGQEIFLPGAKPVNEFKIIKSNRFIWPAKGRITSYYGMRKHPINNGRHFHTGIDIAANYGENIRAAAGGIIVFAGDGGSYGNMVIIRHKNGYLSVYAHASRLLVKKNQYVKQGQVIAKVGQTGVTTGSHLHFEVKRYNKSINPVTALKDKIVKKIKL